MCEHKDLKYFSETDHVVCLKCGKVWGVKNIINQISTPQVAPTISPNTPSLPQKPYVIWS